MLTGEPVAAQRQCGQVERLSLGFGVGLQTLNSLFPFVRSRSRSIAVARVRPNESPSREKKATSSPGRVIQAPRGAKHLGRRDLGEARGQNTGGTED